MRWLHTRIHIAVLFACAALFLSACGPATANAPAATTALETPVHAASPTTTPAGPTAMLPTVDSSSVPTSCANSTAGLAPQSQPAMRLGDLLVSQAAAGLSYPSYQIPQGTSANPLRLTGPMANPDAGAPTVNPSLKGVGGFTFVICNASTSHTDTVQSVSARIASFTPYSGALSAWNPCNDGSYDAQAQSMFGGGCGGGVSVNETLQASFPGNAVAGATAQVTQVSTSITGPGQPDPFPPLPLALAPGQSILVSVGVTPPAATGTYTFAFGLAVNTAAPAYFSTSAPVLLAPVTREWSGQNCATAAMKAQIPAATQSTFFICPPAA